MVMPGMAYLKGQPEVVALADDAYPPWLWSLLKPKELPDAGPGGKAEKVRLRKANRLIPIPSGRLTAFNGRSTKTDTIS